MLPIIMVELDFEDIGEEGLEMDESSAVWGALTPEQKKYFKKIAEKSEADMSHITIDDVVKVELRVGAIKACEEIEGSDKLLKMQIDFGQNGMRQILAGIKKWYTPQDLINKQAVFVYNLKPRKMMGIESQGMMLLAENEQGDLQIVNPVGVVPNGTRLR